MATDDETSSMISFRQRPRQLSKASSVPSPLSGGVSSSYNSMNNTNDNSNDNSSNHGNGSISSHALSSLTFMSTSTEKNSIINAVDTNTKSPSQLRVRHLERESTYAGYLTKFSSRTFFSRKQWKRRYFILHQKSLHCFKSSDPQHPLLESITLAADTIICVTDIFSGKRYCLQISSPGEKNWYVLADTASEMSGWLRELKGTVQRVRNLQLDTRPGTQYSDSSETSDTMTASAIRIPSVPAVPFQYEYISGQSRSLPGTISSPSSPVGSRLSTQHSLYTAPHNMDMYQGQVTSLNPPPRSITPKPSTPTPGAGPQRPQGPSQAYSYGSSPLPPAAASPPPPEPRRRRNSSLSSSQPAPDYASFGSVMERAEAMATEQKDSYSSSWSVPTKSERPESNYATIPRSKRESTMSSMSSTPMNNNRMSAITERQDANATHSRSNSQKQASNQSRPLSPSSPRPMSPGVGRASPRSSLVISPPPRSIHRPVSVSIRHSTQILPPPQIMTSGLSYRSSIASSPLSSNPPTSSLPSTPDSNKNNQNFQGPLSRITSIRHQRDPGLHRQSLINVSSPTAASPVGTGSIHERVQRSSSRTSVMRPTVPTGSNRPLSPTPTLANAPTLPLPEPPRSDSSSPSKALSNQSSISSTSSHSTEPTRPATVSSRQNEPEPPAPLPNRSKARTRSQSQEAALLTSKLNEIQLSRRATTPSPRLSAVMTTTTPTADNNLSNSSNNNSSHKQMSLPIHSMYVLPSPPTRQTPAQPVVSTGSSRPLNQRSSGSSSALRPISSVMSNVASLGGGVARKSSAASAGATNRDSIMSTRLSALISLPPEPTTAVPLPPQSTLPAPPTSALPKKPTDANGSNSSDSDTAHANAQAGFDAILEEEEDEEDDDDDEEFVSHLQFEELEAAKDSTEQDVDQESNVTTPTTETRPEYYATKERKVVEYIFPSEAFST
ncbi:hypothetical protein BGZ50_002741 [Haplosporangium sp. Z 11]|nr:hypothetical protein BGZ50_002741 [Haplosporangium sp. Z 11]